MATFGELSDLDASIVGKALRGIGYFNKSLMLKRSESPTMEIPFVPVARDLGVYLEDAANRTFCVWLSQWQKAKHNDFLSKQGITAEIYSDWKSLPDFAAKFWGEVLTETNPDVNDYTRELATTFVEWCSKRPTKPPEKFREKARFIWERWRRAMKNMPESPIEVQPPPIAQIPDQPEARL